MLSHEEMRKKNARIASTIQRYLWLLPVVFVLIVIISILTKKP